MAVKQIPTEITSEVSARKIKVYIKLRLSEKSDSLFVIIHRHHRCIREYLRVGI